VRRLVIVLANNTQCNGNDGVKLYSIMAGPQQLHCTFRTGVLGMEQVNHSR